MNKTLLAFSLYLLVPMCGLASTLTEEERGIIKRLFIDHSAERIKSSKFSGNSDSIELGRALFFSSILSKDKKMSCSQCHDKNKDWTDHKKTSIKGKRNVPTLWGASMHKWYFWDGRSDSLWSQALAVIENPLEHNLSRVAAVKNVLSNKEMFQMYQNVFGQVNRDAIHKIDKINSCYSPLATNNQCKKGWHEELKTDFKKFINQTFVNIGKSIASFIETIVPPKTKFDYYLDEYPEDIINYLDPSEINGLKLFIGKGRCVNCHFGQNFTDGEFHDIRIKPLKGPVEKGRTAGVESLLKNEFNLLSEYNDFPNLLNHTAYVSVRGQDWGRFKTPTLRRIQYTFPYMHQGQLETLESVIEHYSTFSDSLPLSHHAEQFLQPLNLNQQEIKDLLSFLKTL